MPIGEVYRKEQYSCVSIRQAVGCRKKSYGNSTGLRQIFPSYRKWNTCCHEEHARWSAACKPRDKLPWFTPSFFSESTSAFGTQWSAKDKSHGDPGTRTYCLHLFLIQCCVYHQGWFSDAFTATVWSAKEGSEGENPYVRLPHLHRSRCPLFSTWTLSVHWTQGIHRKSISYQGVSLYTGTGIYDLSRRKLQSNPWGTGHQPGVELVSRQFICW